LDQLVSTDDADDAPADGTDPARTDPARTDPARSDPVLARRAAIARTVGVLKRLGYAALLGSILAFVVAAATSFSSGAVTTAIVLLLAAVVILPVPIVLGYGIRAAEREDRGRA
jgi:hypothetical protein